MGKIKPQALLQQSKKKKASSRISLSTIALLILIVLLILFLMFSTYRHFAHRSENQAEDGFHTGRKVLVEMRSDVPRYAEMEDRVQMNIFNQSRTGIMNMTLVKTI